MAFRIITMIILLMSSLPVYASNYESFELPKFNVFESGDHNLTDNLYSQQLESSSTVLYNSALDPNYGCEDSNLWCSIKFGLVKAFESGTNGFYAMGYAYHDSRGLHVPTGYVRGLNELALGGGYARTFFNPQYNSEYSLYAVAFMDSYYKPETQIGYLYQKYFDLTDSGNLKWGIGYSPFILTKAGYTDGAPAPFAAAGVLTSLKAGNVDIILFYVSVYLLAVRIDL